MLVIYQKRGRNEERARDREREREWNFCTTMIR